MRCSVFIQWSTFSATKKNYTPPHRWISQANCWMEDARHSPISIKSKPWHKFRWNFYRTQMTQRLLGDSKLFIFVQGYAHFVKTYQRLHSWLGAHFFTYAFYVLKFYWRRWWVENYTRFLLVLLKQYCLLRVA